MIGGCSCRRVLDLKKQLTLENRDYPEAVNRSVNLIYLFIFGMDSIQSCFSFMVYRKEKRGNEGRFL